MLRKQNDEKQTRLGLWTSDLTFNRQSGDISMCVGWNSRYGPQEKSMQKVWYLKQMNDSHLHNISRRRNAQTITESC